MYDHLQSEGTRNTVFIDHKRFRKLQNYTEYVGNKKTFRLLNRGSAKALDKVAELDGKEL